MLLGSSLAFFAIQQRLTEEEIVRLQDIVTRHNPSLAQDRVMIEGILRSTDNGTMHVEILDRWSATTSRTHIGIGTGDRTRTIRRVPVYEGGVIVGLREEYGIPVADIPIGSFVEVSLQEGSTPNAKEIIFGDFNVH